MEFVFSQSVEKVLTMEKRLTTEQEELMQEKILDGGSVRPKLPQSPPVFTPESDLGDAGQKYSEPDELDEGESGDDDSGQFDPQVQMAVQMGFGVDEAQKLAESGMLGSVLARIQPQSYPPQNPWQMPQMGPPPGYQPGFMPMPWQPPQTVVGQHRPPEGYYPAPQYDPALQQVPAYGPMPNDDLSNLSEVIQSRDRGVAETQSMLGMVIAEMNAMRQQQQAAWLADKMAKYASEGYADVLGKGPVPPGSMQYAERQRVAQTYAFYLQQNPQAAADPTFRESAFDMAVKALHGPRQRTQSASGRQPTPLQRPRKSNDRSDPMSAIARKFREYERQNEGY